MRFNTFRFLCREGARGLTKNWFMSLASVLVLVSCLLMTGCTYLVVENLKYGVDKAQQENMVTVYAEPGKSDEELAKLKEALKNLDNVAAVEFQSNEELLEEKREELGEVLEFLEGDNPLPDTYYVHFKDLELFDETVAAVEKLEGVESIGSDKVMAELMVEIRQVVLSVGFWVIGMLLVVSLFIISNTIKLTVYSRRREIFIMRSVGATGWFIRFPFMVEGVILGSLAGALSYGLVFGLYLTLQLSGVLNFGSFFELISFGKVWWQLLLGFFGCGIVTGVLGSVISISRYLKEQSDKIFET